MHEATLPYDDAAVAIAATAFYEEGRGWRLHLATRAPFQRWAERPSEEYEALNAAEFLQVLEAQLGRWG